MGKWAIFKKGQNSKIFNITIYGPKLLKTQKFGRFWIAWTSPFDMTPHLPKKKFGTQDGRFRPFWLNGGGRNGQISAVRPKSEGGISKSIKSCIGNHPQSLCPIKINTMFILRTVTKLFYHFDATAFLVNLSANWVWITSMWRLFFQNWVCFIIF